MKKVFLMAGLFIAAAALQPTQAQEKIKEAGKDVKEASKDAAKDVKRGAKKAGRKTAEIASKGKARATDSEHKDKVGPNGETIYIDNHSRYYWVDKDGRRNYVVESELKNKNG